MPVEEILASGVVKLEDGRWTHDQVCTVYVWAWKQHPRTHVHTRIINTWPTEYLHDFKLRRALQIRGLCASPSPYSLADVLRAGDIPQATYERRWRKACKLVCQALNKRNEFPKPVVRQLILQSSSTFALDSEKNAVG